MSTSTAMQPGSQDAPAPQSPRFPALLYGVLLLLSGMAIYVAGAASLLFCLLFDAPPSAVRVPQAIVWYAGVPVSAAVILIALDLLILLPRKRKPRVVKWDPPANFDLTVVLTAYNDEASIGLAVADFRSHPRVRRVVVVDNNSADRTAQVARDAGAIVVHESLPGYGRCVWRALVEGRVGRIRN